MLRDRIQELWASGYRLQIVDDFGPGSRVGSRGVHDAIDALLGILKREIKGSSWEGASLACEVLALLGGATLASQLLRDLASCPENETSQREMHALLRVLDQWRANPILFKNEWAGREEEKAERAAKVRAEQAQIEAIKRKARGPDPFGNESERMEYERQLAERYRDEARRAREEEEEKQRRAAQERERERGMSELRAYKEYEERCRREGKIPEGWAKYFGWD